MMVFHNQAQLLSGTMAQRPAHMEQPARQSRHALAGNVPGHVRPEQVPLGPQPH